MTIWANVSGYYLWAALDCKLLQRAWSGVDGLVVFINYCKYELQKWIVCIKINRERIKATNSDLPFAFYNSVYSKSRLIRIRLIQIFAQTG